MTGSEPALAVEGLGFGYRRGGHPVISDLTHGFAAGTVTAITGPSGSGKSTLLYVIGLLLRQSWGTITLHGSVVPQRSDADRSRLRSATMGFVFQDAMLDASRSVQANVLEGAVYTGMTRERARARALVLLDQMGVAHRADHRPGEISGGQAQRVALCRALIKSPTILLADEPSGNLDDHAAELVWTVLAAHAATGAAVIVATHNRLQATAADQRIDLRDVG